MTGCCCCQVLADLIAGSDVAFTAHSPIAVMGLQEYPIELTVLPGKDTAEEMEED